MVLKTPDVPDVLLPTEAGELIVRPLITESLALQVSTFTGSGAGVHEYALPIVLADPSAGWVGEGEEIPLSDADLDEVRSGFYKLAGLSKITSEAADDSDPSVDDITGEGIARDIARKLDAAYFGSNVISTGPIVRNTKQPQGLEDLAGVTAVSAGSAWTSADPFTAAVYGAAAVGATVDAWVANTETALALASIKESTSSKRNLLSPDPSVPGRRSIEGIPLLVSPYVAAGTVWGIPQSRVYVNVREDITVDVSGDAAFTSDQLLIRGKGRFAFLFPHPAAVQKITIT